MEVQNLTDHDLTKKAFVKMNCDHPEYESHVAKAFWSSPGVMLAGVRVTLE